MLAGNGTLSLVLLKLVLLRTPLYARDIKDNALPGYYHCHFRMFSFLFPLALAGFISAPSVKSIRIDVADVGPNTPLAPTITYSVVWGCFSSLLAITKG